MRRIQMQKFPPKKVKLGAALGLSEQGQMKSVCVCV